MQNYRIYADTIEDGPLRWLALFYWFVFINTLIFLPYVLFPSSTYSGWHRVFAALVILGLFGFFFYQRRSILIDGIGRLIFGRGEVTLASTGFTVRRQDSTKKYLWRNVEEIQISQYELEDQTVLHLITFFFKGGRAITVQDEESWPKAQVIKTWSDDIFERVPVKTNEIDEDLSLVIPSVELLDDKMSNG